MIHHNSLQRPLLTQTFFVQSFFGSLLLLIVDNFHHFVYSTFSCTLLSRMVSLLSPDEFMEFGLNLVGFELNRIKRTCAGTNQSRFQSNCVAHPKTCAEMFVDLQTTNIPGARINEPRPKLFVMAIHWLHRMRECIYESFSWSKVL